MSLSKTINHFLDQEMKSKKKILKHREKIENHMKKVGLHSRQIKMINSIFEISEYAARDVMVPRIDVVTFNYDSDKSELEQLLKNNTYSRIPVYEKNIDNIKGILHVKDLYRFMLKSKATGSKRKLDLSKYISEPWFVPESKLIIDLLSEFQSRHLHMSLVVDEYGGFSGIVTMEDVIEEIIGDVQDEFDEEESSIKQLDDNVFSIDARIDIKELNDYFSLNLPFDEVETLGGFLIHKTGYIPKRGQEIRCENLRFKVMSKKKNSLLRVKLSLDDSQQEKKSSMSEESKTSDIPPTQTSP